jgi:hypothetical protein
VTPPVKSGVDRDLERLANKLLAESVGKNERGIARDAEKMAYERGFLSVEELTVYDPANDWHTSDSVFSITVNPGDIDGVEPTICDDGNVRARNPAAQERLALKRHVEDSDRWGGTAEDIPLLGVNDGPRKVCAKCKRPKGLSLFSPDARNSDGLHSWCKECRKAFTSHKRRRTT